MSGESGSRFVISNLSVYVECGSRSCITRLSPKKDCDALITIKKSAVQLWPPRAPLTAGTSVHFIQSHLSHA